MFKLKFILSKLQLLNKFNFPSFNSPFISKSFFILPFSSIFIFALTITCPFLIICSKINNSDLLLIALKKVTKSFSNIDLVDNSKFDETNLFLISEFNEI